MQINKNIFLSISFFAIIVSSIFAKDNAKAEKDIKTTKLDKMDIESYTKPTKNKNESKKNSIKLDYEANNQVIFSVNRESILERCKLAKEMRKSLQDLDQKLYDEIKPMIVDLEKMQQDFQKKIKTLSADARAKEEEAMMRAAQEFQMKNEESKELLKREEYRIIKEFSEELRECCKDFLNQDINANVLLIPIDNAMPVHAKYDATEEILKIIDTAYETKKAPANNAAKKNSSAEDTKSDIKMATK